MSDRKPDDSGKRIKNIAAVIYLLLMVFVVGGSYLNQRGYLDGLSQSAAANGSGN